MCSGHLQQVSKLKLTPLPEAPLNTLMVAAMKLGDLSHPTKALEQHIAWSHRLSEEFFRQGDLERSQVSSASPLICSEKPVMSSLHS